MDNHLGFEATSSRGQRLSKQLRQLSSKRGSIGVMLVSEISGAQKDFSYQNKLQQSIGKEIQRIRLMTTARGKQTLNGTGDRFT
jgi:hypothetical protein